MEAAIGEHGEEDTYTFGVQTFGVHTVETQGPSDVLMEMFGPDDDTIFVAEDDDSGPGLNARITRWLWPGVYFLKVRHYWSTRTGKYWISVRSGG